MIFQFCIHPKSFYKASRTLQESGLSGLPAQRWVQNKVTGDRACALPQDHALPDVNTLRKMADAHGCAALGHSLGPWSLRSPVEISANPSGLSECGLCFGAHEMPRMALGRHSLGMMVLTLTSFFKFLFNFILLFGHTMWHADLVPRPGIKPSTPELALANQAVSTLILSPASLFPCD